MAKPTDPITIHGWKGNAGSYRSVPIDQTDARYNDPLVRIGDYGIAGESFYAREDGGNWPYNKRIQGSLDDVWCRRLIAQMLQQVNELLREHACEVYVWDAYRPVTCQVGLWEHFSEIAKREMPNASEQERRSYVLNYVSDPMSFERADPTTWPVHTSGAAVDLTLRSLVDGQLLDMGARFDEMGIVSHTDFYEDGAGGESKKDIVSIRQNRRLLYWAMSKVGFINYPLEFWHYDWGDQMYVFNCRAMGLDAPQSAWFGYAELPENR